MAGGTGGHVFPALVVAQHLQSQGWEVHWLGTKAGLEATLVPKHHIPIHYISVSGLRKKGFGSWALAPLQLGIALYQSLRIFFQVKPAVVLGMGGFASGPGGIAAWLTRCPLVIHEQNALVGMTNRVLSGLANRVLEAFPGAFKSKVRAVYTGNPVREELFKLPLPKDRLRRAGEQQLKLLILGGSRGAEALNQLCPLALQRLSVDKRPNIWHQSGAGREKATLAFYEKVQVAARIEPFIEDMAAAYSWADLVVCRAGAMTIAELAAVGVGSILIPYPFAVDDHQTYNGRFLEKAGAAKLISQASLTPEKLADLLLALLQDRDQLLKMAEAAKGLARPDAIAQVAAICKEVANYAF